MESFHIFQAIVTYLWLLAGDPPKLIESKELALFAFDLLRKQKVIIIAELDAYRATHDEHPQLSSTKELYTCVISGFAMLESRIKRLLDIETIPTTELVNSSILFDGVVREIHKIMQNDNNKDYITKLRNHQSVNKLFTLLQVLERENPELSEMVASTDDIIVDFFTDSTY